MVVVMKKKKKKKGEEREERGEREYNIINCGAQRLYFNYFTKCEILP